MNATLVKAGDVLIGPTGPPLRVVSVETELKYQGHGKTLDYIGRQLILHCVEQDAPKTD